MWSERTLSIIQALHLVGLIPCAFIIILLIAISRKRLRIIIPCAYFFTLCISFFIPLQPILVSDMDISITWLKLLNAGLPGLAYLLMLQLIKGKMPNLWQLSIYPATLLIQAPAYFSGSEDLCLAQAICVSSGPQLQYLLSILISAGLFLPLLQRLTKYGSVSSEKNIPKAQKYWLLIALLLLHLLIPVSELLFMLEELSSSQLDAIYVTLRFSFIYLVLTSLFRLFDDVVHKSYDDAKRAKRERLSDQDQHAITAIERCISEQAPHRTMALTRAGFAEMLSIPEHKLSRLLNVHFGQNFNEFMNHHRIEDAKIRLTNEPKTSITVIAFEVGFSSIATFNRVFKASVGVSPSAYRSSK